jgi:hypothetical protein
MEEAIQTVREARAALRRAEEELHQLGASLRIKERNADRIIELWLRARREAQNVAN